MEFQDAERTAVSSHDVIQSVAKKLKFYLEVKRREEGFDPSPSYIPRRLYPNLLPRPMLMSGLTDNPMKHHFSHAQVRSAMARLQSYQPHKNPPQKSKRAKAVQREIESALRRMRVDHPMWFANREYDIETDLERLWLKEQSKLTGMQSLPVKKVKRPLRNGVKTIVRAPPPYASAMEKERLLQSTCSLILDTEAIGREPPRVYTEVGNTKLQNLSNPTPLQYSFMAGIHRNFVNSNPRMITDSSMIKKGKNCFVYDLDGRRNKVVVVKDNRQALPAV